MGFTERGEADRVLMLDKAMVDKVIAGRGMKRRGSFFPPGTASCFARLMATVSCSWALINST